MADVAAGADTYGERYHFLVRRLHSLSGIVPVGAFLCIHLSVNASILAGPRAFQFAVDQIHTLNKLGILTAVEVAFIFVPITFHALVGMVIWFSGRPNVRAYQHCGNVRYLLQRWTGVIAFAFIVTHLWHVHWIIPGPTEFDPHAAAETAFRAMSAAWTGPVYAVGVLCAVYHLANGIWTFLITWGITIGPKSQRCSAVVCGMIGIVLGVLGLAALYKFKTMDTPTASRVSLYDHAAGRHHGPDLHV